jgi:hypothetical protein
MLHYVKCVATGGRPWPRTANGATRSEFISYALDWIGERPE